MKRLTTLVVAALVISIVTINCKKKDTPTPSSTNNTPTGSTLCDGNGSSSFFPLAKGDSWGFDYTIANVNQPVSPSLNCGSTTTVNGSSHSYFDITDPSGLMYIEDRYIREDSSNHNIYEYDDNVNYQEYLLVPASPTLNQSWPYINETLKVVNLSASINTSSCSYTGLLEIDEYNGNTVDMKFYYKKGLGLISINQPDGAFTGNFNLTSVTLK